MNTENPTLKITQAKLDDLAELQNLFVNTIEHTCRKDYNEAQLKAWKSSVENKNRWTDAITTQYFLVAKIRNVIVGFGSLKNGEYIDFMYVHKDYLKTGIAAKLYQELEQKSIQLGKLKITSDVSKTAKPFFGHKGYLVVKENINIINGTKIINYRMEKNLSLQAQPGI